MPKTLLRDKLMFALVESGHVAEGAFVVSGKFYKAPCLKLTSHAGKPLYFFIGMAGALRRGVSASNSTSLSHTKWYETMTQSGP